MDQASPLETLLRKKNRGIPWGKRFLYYICPTAPPPAASPFTLATMSSGNADYFWRNSVPLSRIPTHALPSPPKKDMYQWSAGHADRYASRVSSDSQSGWP